VLERYSWSGNVRGLQHVVERALLHSPPGTLRFDGILPGQHGEPAEGVESVSSARAPSNVIVPEREWRKRERQNLRAALQLCGAGFTEPAAPPSFWE
jgi:DNA-binding NtrC family response regulator